MTNKRAFRHCLSASLWLALLVSVPAFSKDSATAAMTETVLQQTFILNGSICFDNDDTEYKNVLMAVRNKWLVEKNAAFKEYSLLASYWLGEHLLIKGAQEEGSRVFDELYSRTRNSASVGERAYSFGAFLEKRRLKYVTAKPNAAEIIAEIKSEFGEEAGKLSLIMKEIDIFQLRFLKKADEATVRSLIPTAVPRYFSEDAVPIAMVNSYDQEIVQMFGPDDDPIVHELYVLKLAGIAKRAWEMNHDVPSAIALSERFINDQKENKDWRIRKERIDLIASYAGLTCRGQRSPESVQKAKMYLDELKEQLSGYQGQFLNLAKNSYSIGQRLCAKM